MIASAIRQYWIAKVEVESFINEINSVDYLFENININKVIEHFEIQNYALKFFIIIQTCAFLDEYTLFFKQIPKDASCNAKAIKFKKEMKSVTSPAIKLINKYWKDLYSVRNNVLAHNWRSNGQPIIFTQLTDLPPNVPWIDEEFTLLIGIFDSIINSLKELNSLFYTEMSTKVDNKKKVHHMTPVLSHDEEY